MTLSKWIETPHSWRRSYGSNTLCGIVMWKSARELGNERAGYIFTLSTGGGAVRRNIVYETVEEAQRWCDDLARRLARKVLADFEE